MIGKFGHKFEDPVYSEALKVLLDNLTQARMLGDFLKWYLAIRGLPYANTGVNADGFL